MGPDGCRRIPHGRRLSDRDPFDGRAIGRRIGIAGVGEDAVEVEPAEIGHRGRQRTRVGRHDPAPPEAALDFDPDAQPQAGRGGRPRQRAGAVDAVHGEDQVRAGRQRHRPLQLRRRHQFVGDQEVADAGVDQHGRLVELGHRHAERARGDLAARDGDRLVGLEMGPDVEVTLGPDAGDPADVALQAVEIDHERRGVRSRPRLAGERGAARGGFGGENHAQKVGGLMMISISASTVPGFTNRWGSSRWTLMLSPASSS